MRHYLHIWALMMLCVHLAALTAVSLVPGEHAGVSIKKVCLRKEAKKQLVASAEKSSPVRQLLQKKPDSQSEQQEGTVEIHCSVKLISTAAADTFVFVPLYLEYQKSGFNQVVYYSLSKFLEPDPPRLS
ncbi:hypothetical protein FVR03_11600 [Pontibacter qinzhouensis]|uniref:Uncharacterized protein n=1 Tax=Pontibacter qinzhouensis TaxID=2603253 RepID=A0A5C8KAE3_9BACT|nr:hypothetical protein [Pontibacter qinzhouensis]TXK45831.1 hypothetical protein FVR03_11600 [Pontibacter qinzhouensis]